MKERKTHAHHAALFNLNYHPKVTIMVPCYNEGANIDEVARYLLNINYPNFEILLINDGSKDDTAARLDRLQTYCIKKTKAKRRHLTMPSDMHKAIS